MSMNHHCNCGGSCGGNCKCHEDENIKTLNQELARINDTTIVDKYASIRDKEGLINPFDFDVSTPTFAAMYPTNDTADDYNMGFVQMTNDTVMGQINTFDANGDPTVVIGIMDRPAIIGSIQKPFGVFVPFNEERKVEINTAMTATQMIFDHVKDEDIKNLPKSIPAGHGHIGISEL